ncbi:response regulator [Epidermidibacterium keratini]|uniref:Response regulator n=1 Tax=Epidermidibacterium keratini TaxID=1891644 RepID=A0A7L4YKQ2_9ACTN|nr:response regulator transcription factor [Epidermidibacterium keratini]QHB99830.1 response regulator [Epidermidibacterium keratini]
MSEQVNIGVLIVDDHPVVRDGIRGIFESDPRFRVIGEAGDGKEAVAWLEREVADVVLMDLRMPRMGGVEAITAIRRRWPETRIVVLTTFDSDTDVLPAIEAGATGYLLKDATADELRSATLAAAGGRPVITASVAGHLVQRVGPLRSASLSRREHEVLELVAGGATNRQIGTRLHVSETTVKTHLMHIFGKLGVRDRAAAVNEAHKRGLL